MENSQDIIWGEIIPLLWLNESTESRTDHGLVLDISRSQWLISDPAVVILGDQRQNTSDSYSLPFFNAFHPRTDMRGLIWARRPPCQCREPVLIDNGVLMLPKFGHQTQL